MVRSGGLCGRSRLYALALVYHRSLDRRRSPIAVGVETGVGSIREPGRMWPMCAFGSICPRHPGDASRGSGLVTSLRGITISVGVVYPRINLVGQTGIVLRFVVVVVAHSGLGTSWGNGASLRNTASSVVGVNPRVDLVGQMRVMLRSVVVAHAGLGARRRDTGVLWRGVTLCVGRVHSRINLVGQSRVVLWSVTVACSNLSVGWRRASPVMRPSVGVVLLRVRVDARSKDLSASVLAIDSRVQLVQ